MYRLIFKRLIDVVVAILALIICAPIIVSTFLLLKLKNGKAFFFQQRPGYKELPFHIIKFKTMTDDRDEQGNLLPDFQRTTKIGKLIRTLSIDELPQLVNVLKGDMSLVGPRPLLFKYIPLYSKEQSKRHHVRPGITGLAQVSGRNAISWTRKFEFDTYYAENLSLGLDIKILWLTVVKVLKREGINQTNERPMKAFNGLN